MYGRFKMCHLVNIYLKKKQQKHGLHTRKKKDEILPGDIIYQVQISLAWNYIQQIELFTIDTSLLNIPI